jgi:hypothetical protein
MTESKSDIINRLRKNILRCEGFKPQSADTRSVIGLKAGPFFKKVAIYEPPLPFDSRPMV